MTSQIRYAVGWLAAAVVAVVVGVVAADVEVGDFLVLEEEGVCLLFLDMVVLVALSWPRDSTKSNKDIPCSSRGTFFIDLNGDWK